MRRFAVLAVSLVVLVLLGAPGMALTGDAAPAGPAPAASGAPPAAPPTAEEALAAKYAPIAYFKRRTQPCDDSGEQYSPVPVETVLGDPAVVLRRDTGAARAARDPVIVSAPTARDLAGKDRSYYLDLPGNPRNPRCDYEQLSEQRNGTRPPQVYAHVVTEPGVRGVALQYWFYYVFNLFNNVHESDWEMIQLGFDAATVEEALSKEPDTVAFAQHGGGETASWDDPKLKKEDGHPVVFPASGSHATYYGDVRYIGWGEHGSGFGCDDSAPPGVRVPLTISMLPDNPDPAGPFAWLAYRGRWGEKDRSPFDGPTGPNTKRQWTEPFSWQDDLRHSSIGLRSYSTIGPKPTSFFCGLVESGAGLFIVSKPYPWISLSVLALVLLLPVVVIYLLRRLLRATLTLFARNAGTFILLGAVLAVLGSVANPLESTLRAVPLGGSLLDLLNFIAPMQLVKSGSALVQFAGWGLVTPAVVFAVGELRAGRRPSVLSAYRFALAKLGTLLLATARAAVIVFALFISLVGIPWAVTKAVRWLFLPQAIVLDGARWRAAHRVSERAVIGRWWRTALVSVVVVLLVSAVAPVVGLVVLILVTPSVLVANAVSGLVYSLLFPLIGIATTLWFEQRQPLPAPSRTGQPWWRWRPVWPWRRKPSPQAT